MVSEQKVKKASLKTQNAEFGSDGKDDLHQNPLTKSDQLLPRFHTKKNFERESYLF